MSYNGSGTFNINSTGQPVVAGTVITASAFNALTTDLATGLTTAITKDGQTTTTARITFAQGITSSLVTDSSSVSTGSIITAGGAGIAKNLYVGVNANVAGTLGVTGVATFSAAPIYSSLTASSAVATDASKGLVSVTNTGTGNNVLATSPTITTPTISSLSSASATALTLQSAGTTAITVDTSQRVGIGGTPVKTLSILPTSIRRMDFFVRDPGVDDSLVIRSQHATNNNIRDMILEGNNVKVFTGADSGGSGTESMRIDSSGNLLVGTTSNITGAKINIAAGSSDGVMYQIAQFTGGSGTGGNEVGEMKRQTTASVANSATTIESSLTFGELVTVTGVGAGAIFADLLMASYNTVSVISSNTQQGSPASRTYSISSGALKLTMGSATAMYITIQSLISGAKGA
jgi:hypothetical protein